MLYPNEIQAAVLFDHPFTRLQEVAQTFARMLEMELGAPPSVPEAKPGVYYRFFGAGELMVTLEYMDGPARVELFGPALSSVFTGIGCPDVRDRLMRHRSHVLINVSHGVLGNSAAVAQMMQMLGRPMEGATLPQFKQRLHIARLLTRIVNDAVPASLIHWTQSDQLIAGEHFEHVPAEPPALLHIHPFLFGPGDREGGPAKAGIRTFGARHFVGRELLIEPSVIPWAANYETMLAFLRVATMTNGYVIPDGDTFGPEDHSLSYRVTWRDAAEGDVPLYVLTPLLHREHGFVADDYVPRDRVIDSATPPRGVLPAEDGDASEAVSEWADKRALAEGIGGRFEVRVRGDAPMPPPSASPAAPPRRSFLGARMGFGRKGQT